MDRLFEKLDDGIRALRDSDEYRKYMLALSRFREYSFRNTMLIRQQCPDASLVASFSVWKSLGRHVKKGEKSIRILAPIIRREKRSVPHVDPQTGLYDRTNEGNVRTEERDVHIAGFRAVSVFDISQTEGEPLPDIVHPLEGSFEDYEKLSAAIAQAAGVSVTYGKVPDGASGLIDTLLGTVTLQPGLSERQELKTLIHEAAHYRMHPPGCTLPREVREVQAESMAFVVSAYFGLDTSDYSFGYVDGWATGASDDQLRTTVDFVARSAATFIGDVEQCLDRTLERALPQKQSMRPQKRTAPSR